MTFLNKLLRLIGVKQDAQEHTSKNAITVQSVQPDAGYAGGLNSRTDDWELGIDQELSEQFDTVIVQAYMNGISVNGDYYRYNAQVVAAAVSSGLLTTQTTYGNFSRTYRPTHQGLLWVQSVGKV